MVDISIVVPVYGVEKYLKRCIDSLINQTLHNIEIILIDDASLDKSTSIMKEYEECFPEKIRCIYLKENIKQGGARNVGIRESKGDYILFVDSDDWVDVTMCEKMYLKAKEIDGDIVFCDIMKVWEDSLKKEYKMEVGNEISGELTIDKHKELLSMNAYPFSKLIRKEIIIDNGLFFPEKLKYEDGAVVPFFSLYSAKAAKINEALYYYNIRLNSTVHSKNNNHHFDRMETALMFYNQAKERGFYKQYKSEIDFFFIRSFCFRMLENCLDLYNELPKSKMLEINKKMIKLLPDYASNYYINKISDPKQLLMAELNDTDPNRLQNWEKELKTQKLSYSNFYNETIERANELFAFCKVRRYKIALWGAGKKGEEFLLLADKEFKNVKYVIDRNQKKQGTMLKSGHLVSSYEEVMNDISVVLVCNRYHYGSVFSVVKSSCEDVYVINLDIILSYKIEIKDYFNQ